MVPRLCSWLGMTSLQLRQIGHVKKGFSEQRKSPWANGGTPSLAALLAKQKNLLPIAMQILSWKIQESPTQFGWCDVFLIFVLLKGCSLSHVCLKKAPITHVLCGFVAGAYFHRFFYGKVQKSLTAKSPFGFSNREISSTQKTAWMKKHLYAEKNRQLDVSERLMFYWWPGTYNQRT